jgi:hypothetical protein
MKGSKMQNAITASVIENTATNTAEPVVKHDTTAPAANDAVATKPTDAPEKKLSADEVLTGIKSTSDFLDALSAKSNEWANNAYKTSTEQLYGMLQECYCLYKAMEVQSSEAAALRQGLTKYVQEKGYKFTKGTHSLTKIVKCVFGFDRRRVSAYSIVLRSALAKGVGMLELANFVRDAGGVEEVRLAKSPTAKTPKQKSELVRDRVQQQNLGKVDAAHVGAVFDAGKIDSNTVLIGTWQADGSITVRAVVESDTVLTGAMASYFTSLKKAGEDGKKDAPPSAPFPPANTADEKAVIEDAIANAKVDA